jgi:hypothetical protein
VIILEQAEIECTNQIRPLKSKPKVSFDLKDTGNINPAGFATQQEYILTVTIGASFWANKAQYNDALRQARRVVLNTAYGDTLSRIDQAIAAIFHDDTETAIESLNAIRNELVGN